MDEASHYRELSELLTRAGIEVRTEPFKNAPDSAGGVCNVFGRKLVLLDRNASRAEREQALLEVVETIGLGRLGVAGGDLSPALLSRLNRRGQMPWPHKSRAPSLAKADQNPKPKMRLVPSPPSLSTKTTLQLGGPPHEFVEATTEERILSTIRACRERGSQLYVLGGGSNLVIADGGVDGTVLAIRTRGIEIERRGDTARVTAQAGENWHDFVRAMTQLGFSGVECLGGIPGSVGATPIQNVGAYGQQVESTIHEVRAICRETLEVHCLSNASCEFSYRDSIFKNGKKDRYIVSSVTFDLKIGGAPSLRYGELTKSFESDGRDLETLPLFTVFERVVELRKRKSMVSDPLDPNRRCCGSFFVNAIVTRAELNHVQQQAGEPVPTFPADGKDSSTAVKIPSAWLIERAGFHKGFRRGNVGLSTKHTLCLVAHEGATSRELIDFARHVRAVVEQKFSVRLIPEPHFWGFSPLEDGLPT